MSCSGLTAVIPPKPPATLISVLPPELLKLVCELLDLRSLCSARITCHTLEAASWPAFGAAGRERTTHFQARSFEEFLLACEEPIVPYVEHLCLSTRQLLQYFVSKTAWNPSRLAKALNLFKRLQKITLFSCQNVHGNGKPWPPKKTPFSYTYFGGTSQCSSGAGSCSQHTRIGATDLLFQTLAVVNASPAITEMTMQGCSFLAPSAIPSSLSSALPRLTKFEIFVPDDIKHLPPQRLAQTIPALLERLPGLTHLKLNFPQVLWHACCQPAIYNQTPLFALKFPRLETLSLKGIDAPSPGPLVDFLQAHPWLKELILEDCFVEDVGYWEIYFCLRDHLKLERLKLIYSKIQDGLERAPPSTFPSFLLMACVGDFVVDDANFQAVS